MKKLRVGKWFLIWGCGHLTTKTMWGLVNSKLGAGTKDEVLKIARTKQTDGLVRFDVFIFEEHANDTVCKLKELFPNAQIREHRPYHLRVQPSISSVGKSGAAKERECFRFLSININSLSGNKKENLIHWALRDRVSVLALQEHMRCAKDDGGRIRLSGYTVFSSPADLDLEGARGVALAVRRGIPCFERIVSRFYVLVLVILNGRRLLVGCVYVPTIRRIQSQVLRDLAAIVSRERLTVDDVILMGDFNINRQRIQAQCDSARLKVRLCDVDGPPETWHRVPSRKMTAIDHILRCPDSALEATKAIVDREWDLSDHFAIFTDVKVPALTPVPEQIVEEQVAIDKRKLKKFADSIRKNNRFGALLDFVENDEVTVKACEELAGGFVKESHETIKELCARKPAKSKYIGRLSAGTVNLLERRSAQYVKLLDAAKAVRDVEEPSAVEKSRYDTAAAQYRALAERAQVALKEERANNFQDYVKESLDHLSSRHYKEFFAWCNQLSGRKGVNNPRTAPIRDAAGVLHLHPEEILEAWAQTFRKLYSDVSGNSKSAERWKVILPLANDKPVLPELDMPVTWKEVNLVLRQMKGGKAPGETNLTTEWLKVALEGDSDQADPQNDMARCILKIVSAMITQAYVPKCLARSLVVPIPKKGDPTETDNYRGISLMETLLKVTCTLVNKRLTRAVEKAKVLHKEQAGFREGEEGIAQVIGFYEICERRRAAGKPTFVAFVDFKKAYDMVPHEALFRKMEHVGIRGKLLSFLRALYEESKLCVRLSCGKSGEVQLQRGLRQGCPLSPLLFDLYINDVVDSLAAFGVVVPGVAHRATCLLYADDLVLLAESPAQLDKMLLALGKWATTWEMEFGFKKCGAMAIHGDQQSLVRRRPKIQGTEIPVVDHYTYLGIRVDTDFSLKAIGDERALSVRRAIGSALGFLKSRNIPAHVRLKALKSFILPVATFGGELLGMDKRMTAAIQRSMDVGISNALLGKFVENFPRATLYLEANVPPIHVLCSSARNRLFLKSRSLKTWMRTLVENPVSYRGGGQGGRAWIGKTEFWLKRFGPKESATLAGQGSSVTRLNQFQSFAWKEWNDLAHVRNTSSMKAYCERELEKSCGYLHEITYDGRVIRGVSHLTAMRTGTFWTALALAKAKRIPERFLGRCPCCDKEEAETVSHILVSCSSWDVERKAMMAAIYRCLRKLKLDRRWLQKVFFEEDLATLLLGGAVVDPERSWEPFWGSGVQRILGGTFSGVPAAVVEDASKWTVKPLFFHTAIFLDKIHVSRCASVWAHRTTTESRNLSDMAAQLGHVAVISDG